MKLLLAVLLLVPMSAVACDKGCYVFKDTCACDASPELAPSVEPSDEKPPSDKMPSYQREGIKLIDVPSMTAADAKLDREKSDANKEGKAAAGIK